MSTESGESTNLPLCLVDSQQRSAATRSKVRSRNSCGYGDRNSMGLVLARSGSPSSITGLSEYSFALAPNLENLRRHDEGLASPRHARARSRRRLRQAREIRHLKHRRRNGLDGPLRHWVEEQFGKDGIGLQRNGWSQGLEAKFRRLYATRSADSDDAISVFRLMTLGECFEQMKKRKSPPPHQSQSTFDTTQSRASVRTQSAVAICRFFN